MDHLVVNRWTAEQFFAGREAWRSLLDGSSADPLFMSWEWASAWWRHHGEGLRGELCVLAAHSQAGELVGIAPFYVHGARHLGSIPVRRMELLGNTWRDSSAVFSEYLDVIARAGFREQVGDSIATWLRAADSWDELVLCNLRTNSVAELIAAGLQGFAHLRCAETMTAWYIDLPESFEAFTSRLSSNTRRKVVNQREKMPGLVFENVPPELRAEALERLRGFVARRFATPSADDSRGRADFHGDVVANGVGPGTVHLTELRAAGRCVSVMLNVRIGGTEYYLQSGFDPLVANGLSPGMLHLGYAIEAACHDRVRRFDFLAGHGRHRDYKQDFATESAPLFTLHIVRQPLLRALFRVADALRGRTSHKARGGG